MTRNAPEERALIERLRARDPEAVSDLSTLYRARIFQLALRHLKNFEDAEEVTQDVLMRVYRKIEAFRGDAALSSWIYRITFNAAMSRLRSVRYSRPLEVPADFGLPNDGGDRHHPAIEAVDWSSMADEAYLRSELRARLEEAMEDLPKIYRTPVELRDLRGLSTEEASRALKVKNQTLKSRLHRGRLILRKRLAAFETGLSLHRAAA